MTEHTSPPAHRHAIESRSGDTHEIGEDGALRNLDQQARDVALGEVIAPVRDALGKPLNPPPGNVTDAPGRILPRTNPLSPPDRPVTSTT